MTLKEECKNINVFPEDDNEGAVKKYKEVENKLEKYAQNLIDKIKKISSAEDNTIKMPINASYLKQTVEDLEQKYIKILMTEIKNKDGYTIEDGGGVLKITKPNNELVVFSVSSNLNLKKVIKDLEEIIEQVSVE